MSEIIEYVRWALEFIGVVTIGLLIVVVFYRRSRRQRIAGEETITLVFTPAIRQRIENLRVLSEKTSWDRIISCALAVYETLWQVRTHDGEVVLLRKDGTQQILLLDENR